MFRFPLNGLSNLLVDHGHGSTAPHASAGVPFFIQTVAGSV
ncbi:hypothetical protein Z950_3716 [Sulfitobacter mediterraneus KCTC 32188]|nr:hypothetical protein Z950_3716 [Sulfitobacter mediterraneus KCTC 32188]